MISPYVYIIKIIWVLLLDSHEFDFTVQSVKSWMAIFHLFDLRTLFHNVSLEYYLNPLASQIIFTLFYRKFHIHQ